MVVTRHFSSSYGRNYRKYNFKYNAHMDLETRRCKGNQFYYKASRRGIMYDNRYRIRGNFSKPFGRERKMHMIIVLTFKEISNLNSRRRSWYK